MNIKDYLLFDGAYGTYYNNSNLKNCELANIFDAESILKIHNEYIESGCMAIKTNTYGANTYNLDCDFEIVENVVVKGFEIACMAAKDNIHVFADIGSILDDDKNYDIDQYYKIIDIFINAGAKNFLFETYSDFSIFPDIIPYIRKKVNDSYIITSFAVDPLGYTKKGLFYKDIIKNVRDISDAYGFNCLSGPTHLLEIVSKLEIGDSTISVMPNAGYPVVTGGRLIYNDNPEYFAEKVKEIYKSGVKIIGGCCGTTPNHIKCLAKLLNQKTGKIQIKEVKEETASYNLVNNSFKDKLLNGEKVVACELHSPLDTNYFNLLEKSHVLKNVQADIITIADSPLGRARADSFITSAKIKREIGIDAMPHLCCRDRNNIAIRGALIAGYAENLRNILVITGDNVSSGDNGIGKGVFDFNSFKLISYIQSLNEQLFSGQEYFIGCGANINSTNFDAELKRCLKKQESGAKYVFTQPVYNKKGIENLNRIKQDTDLKVLAGIMPLASYKNALFLNNEVAGINIPENIVKLYKDKDAKECEDISFNVFSEIADELYDNVDGFYFMCPLNRTEVVARLTKRIKEKK